MEANRIAARLPDRFVAIMNFMLNVHHLAATEAAMDNISNPQQPKALSEDVQRFVRIMNGTYARLRYETCVYLNLPLSCADQITNQQIRFYLEKTLDSDNRK